MRVQKKDICTILKLKSLLIYLILGLPSGLSAQVFTDQHFRDLAAEGLEDTYNCAYEQAHATFSQLAEEYPTHPAPYFLLATNRWWQTFITTSHELHPQIETLLDTVLHLNETQLEASPYQLEYNFFQYMTYAFKARLHTLRHEWMSAANDGRKALPYLGECLAYADSSAEFYFSAGIYHYYADTYPRDHFYVRPFMIFFPDGNAELGLQELEKAVSVPNFTRPEAMYYLSYIYLEKGVRSKEKAQAISAQLHREYPGNPWFACEYARVRVHTGKHREALPVLDQLIGRYESIPGSDDQQITSLVSPYTTFLMTRVWHYRGMCMMYGKKRHEEAIMAFEKSLKYADLCGLEGEPYLPASWYYIGRCKEALELPEEAVFAYRKVLKMDGNEAYEDKAKAALKNLQ